MNPRAPTRPVLLLPHTASVRQLRRVSERDHPLTRTSCLGAHAANARASLLHNARMSRAACARNRNHSVQRTALLERTLRRPAASRRLDPGIAHAVSDAASVRPLHATRTSMRGWSVVVRLPHESGGAHTHMSRREAARPLALPIKAALHG